MPLDGHTLYTENSSKFLEISSFTLFQGDAAVFRALDERRDRSRALIAWTRSPRDHRSDMLIWDFK